MLTTDPLWTDVVTTIVALVGIPFLVAGAAFAGYQLLLAKNTAQAELLSELARRWDESELVEARKAALSYRDGEALWAALDKMAKNTPERVRLLALPNYFEQLGIFVKTNALSVDLVELYLRLSVVDFWKLYETSVTSLQEQAKSKKVYEWFKYLYDRMPK